MKLKILAKTCPNCKSKVLLPAFRNREEIIRCPHCKSLLIENLRRRQLASLLFFAAVLAAVFLSSYGFPAYWAILLLLVTAFISLKLINLKVVQKDLMIRNKTTDRISYASYADWEDILRNNIGKENSFEIVEDLGDKKIQENS